MTGTKYFCGSAPSVESHCGAPTPDTHINHASFHALIFSHSHLIITQLRKKPRERIKVSIDRTFFFSLTSTSLGTTTRRVHHHFSRCPRGLVNNRFLPRLLAQGAAEGIYLFMLSSSVALASSSSKTYKTRRCRTGSKYVSGSAPSVKLCTGCLYETNIIKKGGRRLDLTF